MCRWMGKKQIGANGADVCLDLVKWRHRTLFRYLRRVFSLNKTLSGLNSRGSLFSFLLTWNDSIPLLGYVEHQATFSIEILGQALNANSDKRGWDMLWLSTNKFYGRFKIIERELKNEAGGNEVFIICMWITGPEAGKSFLVARSQMLNRQQGATVPSVIYFPPKMLVFGAEIGLSAGAILAFLQLTKDGWSLLAPLWSLMLDFVTSFWEWFNTLIK
jgi:hypothetical protein